MSIRCWGDNSSGRLGIGYASSGNDAASIGIPVPTAVVGVKDAVALSHRLDNASCARLSTGRYMCWGPSGFGELPGVPAPSWHLTPIEIPEFAGATKVTMGADFGCALFGGEVKCSGRNQFGELGDGTTVERHVLAAVSGVTTAIDIACRQGAAFALLADHTVVWWGVAVGTDAQIGEQHLTPIPLGVSNVQQVATSGVHDCIRLADGSVQCSGLNDHGQLGDGTLKSRATMAPVPGLSDVVDIATGYFNTCAIVKSGALYCWGGNQYGQMATGQTGPVQTTPLLIGGL